MLKFLCNTKTTVSQYIARQSYIHSVHTHTRTAHGIPPPWKSPVVGCCYSGSLWRTSLSPPKLLITGFIQQTPFSSEGRGRNSASKKKYN